jgi:hypothetical protein
MKEAKCEAVILREPCANCASRTNLRDVCAVNYCFLCELRADSVISVLKL